ncbi:MAG: helix-turn-helix domain-containing protein [Haloarculaceae archaeon]
MPRARLQLTIPEETWAHDVSVAYPDASFSVVAVLSGEGSGVVLVEIRARDPVPVIASIEGRDDVTAFDLLWKRDETTVVQVETTDPSLLLPAQAAGIPLQTPFEVTDGVATWEVTTSADRLSALGTQLEEAGVEFDIDYVRDEHSDPADHLLTDRQQEVLLAAAGQGYYDTPRRATLTEVSESLGIAPATGSDLLHRAESSVLTWFIHAHLAADDAPAG